MGIVTPLFAGSVTFQVPRLIPRDDIPAPYQDHMDGEGQYRAYKFFDVCEQEIGSCTLNFNDAADFINCAQLTDQRALFFPLHGNGVIEGFVYQASYNGQETKWLPGHSGSHNSIHYMFNLAADTKTHIEFTMSMKAVENNNLRHFPVARR